MATKIITTNCARSALQSFETSYYSDLLWKLQNLRYGRTTTSYDIASLADATESAALWRLRMFELGLDLGTPAGIKNQGAYVMSRSTLSGIDNFPVETRSPN